MTDASTGSDGSPLSHGSRAYRVGGMTCGGCVRSVEKALAPLASTLRVEVQLSPGRVIIEGDHDVRDLAARIEGAGFDFLGEET